MAQRKVKAIADGFHIVYRVAGEVFYVPEHFAGKWYKDAGKDEKITRPDLIPYDASKTMKTLSLKPDRDAKLTKHDLPLA